jgi:hypothetical protein
MAPHSFRLAPRPTASGASLAPPSGRRSSGRARRPRPNTSSRREAPTPARGAARGRAPGVLAVVLPGGPLHLLLREPKAAEARHMEPSALSRTKTSGSKCARYSGGSPRRKYVTPHLAGSGSGRTPPRRLHSLRDSFLIIYNIRAKKGTAVCCRVQAPTPLRSGDRHTSGTRSWGWARLCELRRTPYRRSSQNSPSRLLGE